MDEAYKQTISDPKEKEARMDKRTGSFNIFYFGGGKGDVLISGEKL